MKTDFWWVLPLLSGGASIHQFVSQCRSVPNQIDPRTGCGSVYNPCYIYISVQSVCKFPWFWRHYHIEHVLVISPATHSIYEVPLSVGLCQWQNV